MTLLQSLIISTGLWRAVLVTPGGDLPFQIQVDKTPESYTLTVINGEERILLDDVMIKGDSVIVTFPVYESEMRMRVVNKDELEGKFVNLTRTTNAEIPLSAHAGNEPRFFQRSREPAKVVDGRWSVTFSPGTKDSSRAVGVFKQQGAVVTGTFLTPSGDYRYLEGIVEDDSLFLSTFNGVFVYLFKAKVRKNTLEGMYYSGTHWQEPWTAFRDENARLPDADAITTYKSGDKDAFNFRFPDTDSTLVSLSDPRFKGKPVVVQILGSWCPNCLDETQFLTAYYDENQGRGFEFVGLAFEKTDDFARASANVQRLRNRLNIHYPLLIAANRNKLKTVIPGLENFISFPTTIYLDKNHRVRKIHAGFSGGATGEEYEKFKMDFSQFMDKLIAE